MASLLFLTASPRDTQKLDHGEELRACKREIRSAKYGDDIEIITQEAARSDDVVDAMARDCPQIVHFSGHCTDRGDLILTSDSGESAYVPPAGLATALALLASRPRLIIFNGCHTRAQAEALIGVADCVVATNAVVSDPTAISFTKGFYRTLALGRSIQDSFDAGMASVCIQAAENRDLYVLRTHAPELVHQCLVGPKTSILEPPPLTEVAIGKHTSGHANDSGHNQNVAGRNSYIHGRVAPIGSAATKSPISPDGHHVVSISNSETPSSVARLTERRSTVLIAIMLVGGLISGLFMLGWSLSRSSSSRHEDKGLVAVDRPAPHHVNRSVTVAELLHTQLTAISQQDSDAYMATFSPGAFRFGSLAKDVIEGTTQLSSDEERWFSRDRRPHIEQVGAPQVVTVAGEGSAFVTLNLEERTPTGDQFITWSQIVERKRGVWESLASHWGYSIKNQKAFAASRDNRLPELSTIPIRTHSADAEEIADITRRALQSKRLDTLASAKADLLVIGSDPTEYGRGGQARKFLGTLRGKLALSSMLHANTAGSGMGWLAANVTYVNKDKQLRVPYRLLAAYARESGTWKLVFAHFSNGGPIP